MPIDFDIFGRIDKCNLTGVELIAQFQKTAIEARTMPTQASDDMLIAYGYYKQATVGNNENEAPPETDMVHAFMHKTWSKLKGMTKEEAMRIYIDFINYLDLKSKL